MKLNPTSWLLRDEGNLIAMFGEARLFKKLNGKFELRGGTEADRTEAREWCSLFLHEAVFICSPRQVRRAAPANHQFRRA